MSYLNNCSREHARPAPIEMPKQVLGMAMIAVPRVGGYVRVSTEDQATSGDSIDTQKKACIAHLDKELGAGCYQAEFYEDPGKSGGLGPAPWEFKNPPKKHRKELRRLLNDLYSGVLTHVCAISMDRIYRNGAFWDVFYEEVRKRGITVLLVSETLDDSPSGQLSSSLLAQVAQYQRNQSRQRSQYSIDKKKDEGYCLGTVPFGYRREKEEEKKHRRTNIVAVPGDVEIVGRVFALYLQGHSARSISEILNSDGVSFNKGKGGGWYPLRVLNILKNPVYAGLVPNKLGELIQGLHWDQRVVELAEHQQVLRQVSRNRTSMKGPAMTRPSRYFARIIRCGICGHFLESNFATDSPSYRCSNRMRKPGSGCGVSVSARNLEAAICGELATLSQRPDVLAEAKEQIARQVEADLTPLRQERDERLKAAQKAAAGRDRLVNAIADGEVKAKDVSSRIDDNSAQLAACMARIKEIDLRLAFDDDRKNLYERAIAHLPQFGRLWDAMDDMERRELIRVCVESMRIRLEEGRLKLKLKLVLLPEKEIEVLRGRHRYFYDKPEGPEGLTPRQLAFLAHVRHGRKIREIASLMGVRESQIYRLRHEVRSWLQVETDKAAAKVASCYIDKHFDALPLYGAQKGQTLGRHRRLITIEWQVLCSRAQGSSVEQIARLGDIPVDVVEKRLASALAKAGCTEPVEAVDEVRRLELAPGGRKTWQWGTRRRLAG